MRVAYADPPYIGKAAKFYRHHPDYAGEVDHGALIRQLIEEFPDGWALSCHTPSLRLLLPLCPSDVRVSAWVKPRAIYKPGVSVQYAWEPVLWRGGRKRSREQCTPKDWVSSNAFMGETYEHVRVLGKKPEGFCFWLFLMLNLQTGDELVDLFPGSGAVTRAWEKWQRQLFAV